MQYYRLIVFLVGPSAVAHRLCWHTLPGHQVFYDTRGTGHVQMGYISAIHDNYPDPPTPSGQPSMTAELCMRACDAIGMDICAAAQLFTCSEGNWCNLLTPTEYCDALELPELPIVDTFTVVGDAFERGRCHEEESHSSSDSSCDSSSDSSSSDSSSDSSSSESSSDSSSDSSSSESSSSDSSSDSSSSHHNHHRDHSNHGDNHNYQIYGHKSKPKSKSKGGSQGDCDSKSSKRSL